MVAMVWLEEPGDHPGRPKLVIRPRVRSVGDWHDWLGDNMELRKLTPQRVSNSFLRDQQATIWQTEATISGSH